MAQARPPNWPYRIKCSERPNLGRYFLSIIERLVLPKFDFIFVTNRMWKTYLELYLNKEKSRVMKGGGFDFETPPFLNSLKIYYEENGRPNVCFPFQRQCNIMSFFTSNNTKYYKNDILKLKKSTIRNTKRMKTCQLPMQTFHSRIIKTRHAFAELVKLYLPRYQCENTMWINLNRLK